jgi:hypothetical protein
MHTNCTADVLVKKMPLYNFRLVIRRLLFSYTTPTMKLKSPKVENHLPAKCKTNDKDKTLRKHYDFGMKVDKEEHLSITVPI